MTTAALVGTDLEQVYRAIRTLYSQDQSIAFTDKQAASTWLNDFQKSLHAWETADQLLHKKIDLESCYFGAHTLRTKIQVYFHELPPTAHVSLRDSLLQHIAAINGSTDHIIVTQLCLAVTHLILQSTTWADPIGHLLHNFGSDASHWWPVLEILTLLPEEVHSRKLQLGENRRHQVTQQLESVAGTVLAFLKQSLTVCLSTPAHLNVIPVDTCLVAIVKCFGSWVLINPDCFFTSRDTVAVEVLNFVIATLRDGKCSPKLHTAATDAVCAVAEIVADIDSQSNNNANELQSLQLTLHTSFLGFSDAYAYAVAEEDVDKVLNYCRIFTEYGENMVPYMLRSSREPHYSIVIIERILDCLDHHDYEVAENTFGFWYRLTEDLYHAHDDMLNAIFRGYSQRLLVALFKHCCIEPDHEGPLTSSDEFYEFRRKAAEIVEDILFVTGAASAFEELARFFINEQSWEVKESALFLLYHMSRAVETLESSVIESLMHTILSCSDWRHICLKMSSIRLIGGMAGWLNRHPDGNLERALNILVAYLPDTICCNAAATALQSICQQCAEHIAAKYMENLLRIVAEMDRHNVCNEAVVGLLKGVGHVIGILPRDQLSAIIRQICWAQIDPLNQLCESDAPYAKGTKSDPVFWVDRLSALFRNSSVQEKGASNDEHPCSTAICQDLWPVLSKTFDKYQADPRTMERVCRCLRYAVRCVGKHSHPFLSPLVFKLVTIYNTHHHSCLLYLGSILVDEYGTDAQCVDGLLQMLMQVMQSTFTLLDGPSGFRNHPDTVDDFFRLCARFLQRCPLPLLRSDIIGPIVQCAIHGTQLDHREANVSVMKFLHDLVHAARRQKDSIDYYDRSAAVKIILGNMGQHLVCMLIHGVIYTLPSYTITDVAELMYEMKEVMQQDFAKWVEEALRQLPSQTPVGSQTATLEQLQTFQKQVMRASSAKELSRTIKEFCRYFR